MMTNKFFYLFNLFRAKLQVLQHLFDNPGANNVMAIERIVLLSIVESLRFRLSDVMEESGKSDLKRLPVSCRMIKRTQTMLPYIVNMGFVLAHSDHLYEFL